jgi:hypothetical protein
MYRERQAIYGDKTATRIISAPNGLWQAQRRMSHTKGTNAYTDANKVFHPHFDPWENVGAACGKSRAAAIVWGMTPDAVPPK